MRAVVQDRYGPIESLQIQEVARPTIADDQVLVRVVASSVHADVWHAITGVPAVMRLMGAGLVRPNNPIPGIDLAGVVVEVGATVTRFQEGDAVFGDRASGFQWQNGGTYAEYAAVPADDLVRKPENISFEQAAVLPTAGFIALTNLRAGGPLERGQRVLVNGAGGNVGTLSVQLAKSAGAHVTAVDAGPKLEMLRQLGADVQIDYTRTDATAEGGPYDLIFDVASTLKLSDCRRVLHPDGVYVLIGHDHYGESGRDWLGSIPAFLRLMLCKPFTGHVAMPETPPPVADVLAELASLVEAGALIPVVDRSFPLDEVVEAFRYLKTGQALGQVALTIGPLARSIPG
jgi:NADPH:quinone reductase-like Zn-dependent oxidoreductase